MTKYYGLLVSEFDNTIEDIDTEACWRPEHESFGFSYCKWLKTIEERDEMRIYLREKLTKGVKK